MSEFFVPVTGYEGLYEISNLGRVKSLERVVNNNMGVRVLRCKILKGSCDNLGYPSVTLCKHGNCRAFRVHRLVGYHFILNPENKKEINHINGIRNDNSLGNLEWVSHQENITHSIKVLKTNLPGSGSKTAYFSKDQTIAILKKYHINYTKVKDIALEFNCSQGTIFGIVSGSTYKTEFFDFIKFHKPRLPRLRYRKSWHDNENR